MAGTRQSYYLVQDHLKYMFPYWSYLSVVADHKGRDYF